MKKGLRFAFALILSTLIITVAKSQSDKLAYVVTDSLQNGVKWNYLRKIDLRTGTFSGILLRLLNSNDTVANSSVFNGIAAIALDDKNKRLYYTPMLADRLNYVDLKTMHTYIVTDNFAGLVPKAVDQSNIFTRMVIGDDDNGYALTNDGKHLVKFNTKTHHTRNLGSLINAPQNEVSVHEICSSYGGDIIAAGNDLLYLVTSRNHVFKINIETRVARYLGTINGLSQNFTTSGAAVDYRKGRVVIAGAVDGSDIYSVDLRTLVAVRLYALNSLPSSDLANSNVLKMKEYNDDKDDERNIFVNASQPGNDHIQLYPNPVTTNEFKVKFTDILPGTYTVNVISTIGQIISTTKVESFSSKNNIATIMLLPLTAKGIYIVRINDKSNKTIFSEKIILL